MYTFEYPPHSILDIISRTPLSMSNFFSICLRLTVSNTKYIAGKHENPFKCISAPRMAMYWQTTRPADSSDFP